MLQLISKISAADATSIFNPAGSTVDIVYIFDKIMTGTLFVGVLIFVAMAYAAFLILFSGGDPKKVETGKKVLIYVLIGGTIVGLSYGILSVFINIANL